MGDVHNRGGDVFLGAEGIWKMSVHSLQFCCVQKSTLKTKILKIKIDEKKTDHTNEIIEEMQYNCRLAKHSFLFFTEIV